MKKADICNRTIKSCFNFGFEEMELESIIGQRRSLLHLEDFQEGGSMEKFFDYTVGRFMDEFACVVSFR